MKWHRSFLAHYRRRRFAWLFYTLLATMGIHPLMEFVAPRVELLDWLLGANLAAAVAGVELGRRTRPLIWLGIAFVMARLAAPLLGTGWLFSLSQVLGAFGCLIAAALAVQYALRRGPMDSERIFAALAAYLLAAFAFGVLVWALQREVPGSFGPAPLTMTTQIAMYVSLATISTLGPGDIVPLNGPARGLMTFEAVSGQIYLAVLIARLVSLYAAPESRRGDRERD